MKVLVTRTDRLGDLVLSLPVLDHIHRVRPDWDLHIMTAPASVPVVEQHPAVKGVWTWHEFLSEVEQADLTDRLRDVGFDTALMLQYRRELAGLLKTAGIGRRYGPWSKPSSWFLLNKGTWQARSRGDRHEADYNLDLARRLTGGDTPDPLPVIHLAEGQRQAGLVFRRTEAAGADTVVMVHPGSGGSALDWRPERYAGVANALAAQAGFRVFVTGSERDRTMVENVYSQLDDRVTVLLGRYDLREFLGIVSGADLLIAPSTGPLHLAAALDVGALGLYPPVRTMSPARWGPRGPFTATVVPSVACPARRLCKEDRCRLYNCMDAVYERDVLAAALDLVRRRDARHAKDAD